MNAFEPQQQAHESPLPAMPEDTLLMLRRWTEAADRRADALATRGGQERKTAARHLESAELYDEEAVKARAKADELRDLITIVEDLRRTTGQPSGESSADEPLAGAS